MKKQKSSNIEWLNLDDDMFGDDSIFNVTQNDIDDIEAQIRRMDGRADTPPALK